MKTLSLIAAASVLASGCVAVDAARDAVRPPGLNPISTPQPLAGPGVATLPMPDRANGEAAGVNSLWRAGARAFFRDQRAQDIGDILTVRIQIDDRARVQNQTSRTRSSEDSLGVDALFGLENQIDNILPNAVPGSLVGASGESSFQGQGQVDRRETVELTLAAMVVDILPNGNLVIAGRQQVLVNAERRDLTVTGIIRPQDVAADNTISNRQIAEARISYGGRGTVSDVQRPRWGQQLTNAVTPW
jgi:flagellar L-ring protein precursor FlgH